jgi:hypothetical protein
MFQLGAMLIGLVSGFLGGLLGVGGGILMVPMFRMLAGIDMQKAVGTSLAIMAPMAFMGAVTKARAGHWDFTSFAWAVALAIAGGVLGAAYGNSLRSETLEKVFGAFLIAVGVYMLVRK